jgi:quercetin dioxygenase-like cupin family protein
MEQSPSIAFKGLYAFMFWGRHMKSAGQVLTVPAGLKHDVEAREESAFLLTIAWPAATALDAHRHEGYGA